MLQAVKGHYKLYFKMIIFLNRVDIVLTQETLQGFLKLFRSDTSDFTYSGR